jgi:hypothetical protein
LNIRVRYNIGHFENTLFRFPNPSLCIASNFHCGNFGSNKVVLQSLRTPSGIVTKTASAFSVSVASGLAGFVDLTVTSAPLSEYLISLAA